VFPNLIKMGKRVSFRSPSVLYLLVCSRCRGFLFSLDHTQAHTSVGRTPLDEGSARHRDLYPTTQTLYKRQISMLPVGFEPAIPSSAPPQTHALDRAATGIGGKTCTFRNIKTTPVRMDKHVTFYHQSITNSSVSPPSVTPTCHN
jgi:hypothetical protein